MAILKNQVNVKGAIEQWLKTTYTDGLTNEFNTAPSLINIMKRDTIEGDTIKKHWALGVTDNVVALGKSNDTFELGLEDYHGAVDTVEGEFDTVKIMGTFALSDEVIVRGTNNGAIFNVVKDSLNRMQIGLKHKMARYVYGSRSGKIGVSEIKTADCEYVAGIGHVLTCDVTNSLSLLPGMGVLFHDGEGTPDWFEGKIWQKDSSTLHSDKLKIVIKKVKASMIDTNLADPEAVITIDGSDKEFNVYSRQLQMADGKEISPEYTGLEDIVMTKDNEIFGVNRSKYSSLNCTIVDLDDEVITESDLRDLSDHININANDTANIQTVVSRHRIISTLEKQMYQFKRYEINDGSNGFALGRPDITFDGWKFHKDKFSRDDNIYLLDTDKIGELLRKDWSWLTSGTRESVLERRDGTEIWEGIMNKYADMYVEEWRVHAAFKNAADEYGVEEGN